MSIRYTTYVGPYVRCAVETAVDSWAVSEAIGEVLTTAHGDGYATWVRAEQAHLWIANVSARGRDYHLEDRVDFALIEITPDLVRDELAQFAAQFAEELAVLREQYGASAVSLHWGVLQDYT